MAEGEFGLDQEINLACRRTTIRGELSRNNGHTMRLWTQTIKEPEPAVVAHWAVIYQQSNNSEMFKIAKADFDCLRGAGVCDECTYI